MHALRLLLVLVATFASGCADCGGREITPGSSPDVAAPSSSSDAAAPHDFDRGENGLWARRHWVHGGQTDFAALAADLRARGVTHYYPFLGPPDGAGRPGWRKDGVITPWSPATATRFLEGLRAHSPEVQVTPWTGGVLGEDIDFDDGERLRRWAKQLRAVVDAGAAGVQINVEPMPSGARAYLQLLELVREELGPEPRLAIAAYPPETPLHPFPSVHWSLDFITEVCLRSDEMAFMAYDTALKDGGQYRQLVADWTVQLAGALDLPEETGCDWLMGVPAYEDEGVAYHHPEAETLENGIAGVIDGLSALKTTPKRFRGIALYASWTTDEDEWATYDRRWREREPVGGTTPDGPGWTP